MEKRVVCAYVMILAMATSMILRLAVLGGGGELKAAAAGQSIYTLEVGEERGIIYDRDLKPMVCNSSRTVLSVAPGPETLASLKALLPEAEFLQDLGLLESGKPVLLTTDAPPGSAPGVEAFSIPIRYSPDQTAPHVIGYLDTQGQGVTGVEKGYDQFLRSWGGEIKTKYLVDARGGVLGGEVYEIEDSRSPVKGGVVLTLDRDIQKMVERAAQKLGKGAVVVMEAATGEILAMASCPDYDVTNVAEALDDPDSPLFNRATAAYNVGSTFKMCVAAAALEQGLTMDYEYFCGGFYQLEDVRYHCHNRMGHGLLDMTGATCHSCNPYFVNLGQQVGARRLYEMAYALGFGSAARLAEGITSDAGSLPPVSRIDSGELANLSFGQGKLTATPVQLAQMYAVIANGGMSVVPTLCRGVTTDGAHLTPDEQSPTRRVMSERTARSLRQMLGEVIADGSGEAAAPQYLTAGGKTASAQTGTYDDEGQEIVHGWFVGIYPLESPQYSIAVFQEGGGSGGEVPAEVFKEICEGLFLQNSQTLAG